jgi:hypothetical protein
VEGLKVAVGLQRDSKNRIIRAPLAIFLPGTFGNLNEVMGNRWLDSLTRLGYHVVAFPNPFGTDFVSEIPISKLGTVTNEAENLYGVVREVFKKLRLLHGLNGTVRLIGISLGGFFTSVLGALDAEHPNPIFTTDMTIMAPPFHIGRGIDRLDALVDELRDPFQEMGLIKMYLKFRRACNLEDPTNPGQEVLTDAKGLVAFPGFYKGLMKSVKAYDKVRNLNYVPSEKKAYQEWKNRFKFSTYYKDLNQEGRKIILSKKGHLYYWISRAQAAGFPNIRVLTTTDDFFNDSGVWGSIEDNPLKDGMGGIYDLMLNEYEWDRIQKDIIVLKYGGHYGFRGNPWFENFIRLAFGSKKDRALQSHKFEELYPEPARKPIVSKSLRNPFR